MYLHKVSEHKGGILNVNKDGVLNKFQNSVTKLLSNDLKEPYVNKDTRVY